MTQYITRRIVLAVPVLIGILFATFVLARVIPGDPCRAVFDLQADAVFNPQLQHHLADGAFGPHPQAIPAGPFWVNGPPTRFAMPLWNEMGSMNRSWSSLAFT